MEILQNYDDVLTFKELMTILKYGRNKTYNLLRKGVIPYTKVGRDYRILKANVIAYLQNSI